MSIKKVVSEAEGVIQANIVDTRKSVVIAVRRGGPNDGIKYLVHEWKGEILVICLDRVGRWSGPFMGNFQALFKEEGDKFDYYVIDNIEDISDIS